MQLFLDSKAAGEPVSKQGLRAIYKHVDGDLFEYIFKSVSVALYNLVHKGPMCSMTTGCKICFDQVHRLGIEKKESYPRVYRGDYDHEQHSSEGG